VDKLLEIIEIVLKKRNILIERTFSYKEAGRIQAIRKYGQLINEEYREDGIYIKAYIPKDIYDMLSALF
jgi:GTP-binding protein HflX